MSGAPWGDDKDVSWSSHTLKNYYPSDEETEALSKVK